MKHTGRVWPLTNAFISARATIPPGVSSQGWGWGCGRGLIRVHRCTFGRSTLDSWEATEGAGSVERALGEHICSDHTFNSREPRCHDVFQSVFQSLRSLLGDELADFLESEDRERRLDAVRSRIRLLRDLRMDTRARGMWARLLNDQPVPRKHKSGIKKGGSSRSGCFGHKMDRIGTISGMGC